MTTEVLRNMIYADSPALHNLGYVVMDEVHYLADRFPRGRLGRGHPSGWASDVQVVSLSPQSATPRSSATGSTPVRGRVEVVSATASGAGTNM